MVHGNHFKMPFLFLKLFYGMGKNDEKLQRKRNFNSFAFALHFI